MAKQTLKSNIIERVIVTVVLLALCYCSFHFASWEFIWNLKLSMFDSAFLQAYGLGYADDAFLITKQSFAIQVNGGYYGLVNTGHFLDSPVLSWILLVVSVICLLGALGKLFFGSVLFFLDDDDD